MYTTVSVFLAFSCACLADNIVFRYGGLGELKDASSKTQQLVDSVSIVFVFNNVFLNNKCKSNGSKFVIIYITNRCDPRDDIIDQLPLGYDKEQSSQLKAIAYRKQLVSGFNYYIKVGNPIPELCMCL